MKVKRTIRKLVGINKRLHANVSAAVVKTTTHVQDDAKGIVPVLTGALRASIYRVTAAGSDYVESVADAGERRPELIDPNRADPFIFSKEEEATSLTGYVGVAASYGIIIEQGRSLPSPLSPRPFLEPAAMQNTDRFRQLIQRAVERSVK